MAVFQHLIGRNFIYPIRIIHEHLPVPFAEIYCRPAFIAAAWIQKIYFYHCSPRKGMSNEFSLDDSKPHAGILLPRVSFKSRVNARWRKSCKKQKSIDPEWLHWQLAFIQCHTFPKLLKMLPFLLKEKRVPGWELQFHLRGGLHTESAAQCIRGWRTIAISIVIAWWSLGPVHRVSTGGRLLSGKEQICRYGNKLSGESLCFWTVAITDHEWICGSPLPRWM